MLQIGLGFVERGDGELLCHSTATKTFYLGKDEPDPVTSLSPGTQFIKDCVIDAFLRVEKAVEIIIVSHGLCSTTL